MNKRQELEFNTSLQNKLLFIGATKNPKVGRLFWLNSLVYVLFCQTVGLTLSKWPTISLV